MKRKKEILFEYYKKEKEQFSKQPAKAENLLKAGEYKHEAVLNKVDAAALMQVVHTMYNMEEAITKS